MNWFYRHYVRPVLFAQDPEHIHRFTLDMLGWAGRHFLMREALGTFFEAPELPVTVWGLRFPNPVGLAAGMDKEGEALPAWEALGFGHCELGAVTAQPQPGNPPPRLFRIIPDEAIINRMGFNNEGAAAVAQALARWRAARAWPRHPVGINLGKTKVAPLDQAPADYAQSLERLWPHADFFVVNVSSPNTPQLRDLQEREALDEILAAMQEVNARCAALAAGRPKPLLVKVAPDLSFAALDKIVSLAGPRALAGLVATNTTVERPEGSIDRSRVYAESGGLSGRPLRKRSKEVIAHLYRQTQGRLPIVGVGGIFDAADAWEKIAAGACLLQVYTALVYEGPGLVRGIVRGLQARLSEMGLPDIPSAVGLAHRA
ncbi:MAG TPA: quinone-dependent dihydroorotate dehydrogenase [Candidatus Paceibacterota bacterium]|nr:quinone-dependent dihydroorotate dehydrogenase [Verrucomicrobiota bacterium]HRZ45434.1 quinone-dependent dihydroorotate dehydrogenase [Candidatus Paceibacterota bacterium]HRZ92376.1 quinone-dependent dihydroorotate dehydrogenase [Candidatus Paceibacterota bacterium]